MVKLLLVTATLVFPILASASSNSLPGPKQLKVMFDTKKNLGCLPLVDEKENYEKCLETSQSAFDKNQFNLSYESFTLGQLKILATRSPYNSNRMKNAKYILRSIGHPIR